MYIDLDFFDIFYAITIAAGFGIAFYFTRRHADKELIKEIREQAAIQLQRINDVDNSVSELKQELEADDCDEEDSNELHIKLSLDDKEEDK